MYTEDGGEVHLAPVARPEQQAECERLGAGGVELASARDSGTSPFQCCPLSQGTSSG